MKTIFDLEQTSRIMTDSEMMNVLSGKSNEVMEDSELNSFDFFDFLDKLSPSRKKIALTAIELYKRMTDRRRYANRIMSSNDIYELMHAEVSDLPEEEFWAIYINHRGNIIKKIRISKGGLDATYVDVRVILREALKCNATGVAVMHNHPSGNTKPSQEDNRLTESLKKSCDIISIRLIDHVIIAHDCYFSYADEGRL